MNEINENVVFVQGAKNGAIYDFNTKKVYAINSIACEIVKNYIEGQIEDSDKPYLKQLREVNLISDIFLPQQYRPYINTNMKLEMAWIEITQKCNMKCLHCYEGNIHKSEKKVLTIDEWKNVIEQLVMQGINRLIIIGGEPCCHAYIKEIICYAASYEIDVTLFTNASLIESTLFECIIENKIRVKISVYGHTDELHDSITQMPGSFSKLKNAVKKLVDNGISVASAVIIMKENQDYLEEIIGFVKAVGMSYSRYDIIREVFGGTQNPHIPTNINVVNDVFFTSPNFSTSKKLFDQHFNRNTCWYGKITVMENGNVIPCEFERNIIYGNVLKNTISEILNKEETRARWFMDFSKIESCCDCEFRYACKDCRPLGYAVCGRITGKNPRCMYDVYNGIWTKTEN